jgi:hypothetical protein
MAQLLVNEFDPELRMIKSDFIRDITRQLLMEASDFNVIGPAASSGKYHPIEELGAGGLARHIRAVFFVLARMMGCNPRYDDPNLRDCMLAAALLHDAEKYTDEGIAHSHMGHPQVMNKRLLAKVSTTQTREQQGQISSIADLVRTHMSRWNYFDENDKELDKNNPDLPKTSDQWLLCYADMVASCKSIHLEFDNNWKLVI